jgi:hypothetical protein
VPQASASCPNLLYGIPAADPVTFVAAALILLATCLAAAFFSRAAGPHASIPQPRCCSELTEVMP